MRKTNRNPYAFFIVLSEAVGALSGWLSRGGMDTFSATAIQPALTPPMWLFPVVWVILYALMGFGAARVCLAPSGASRSRGLQLFVVQLIVNFFWSLFFFNARRYGFSLLWLLLLWTLVLSMILIWRKTDKLAALLQIHYLLWLTFAAYLNLGVWYLNR